MIPFFPTPYPDELWYSVICRYHIRSGNPSVKYSIRELYGANHINVPVELCGALSPLLDALPTKDLTAKDIIMQHTLYPYYTRFFSINRKKVPICWR
uniref:TniQ family protein n=1 Tax=Gemmiger formicilis TaxID=745368 RepID=UPI003FF07E62